MIFIEIEIEINEMKKFKIYAGLGGGFGGANYHFTEEFKNEEVAMEYAYELAVQEYESYEGLHGIRTWEEIREELYEMYPPEELGREDIELAYNEEMESWLVYYVEEVKQIFENK